MKKNIIKKNEKKFELQSVNCNIKKESLRKLKRVA